MKTNYFFLIFSLLVCINSYTQQTKNLRLVFYNVENLFDTIDDKHTNDNEFIPVSDKKWNTERYNTKLKHLSEVISAIGNNELPEIIGLCEIENKTVLSDLISQEKLKQGKYTIIHQESKDPRGIDVALIYRTDEINYISHNYISILKNDTIKLRTRDILYFKCSTVKNDTLHILVNHWPSRMGGESASEPKRIWVAQQIKSINDSILKTSSNAVIVIMGDFNDYPTNRSINEILNATGNKKSRSIKLFNLMYNEHAMGKGTYYYNKQWGCLDQFIVSFSAIRKKNNLSLDYKQHGIFSKEWMLQTNNKGEKYPFKTFNGKNYLGGYSDHLPIFLDFRIKKK